MRKQFNSVRTASGRRMFAFQGALIFNKLLIVESLKVKIVTEWNKASKLPPELIARGSPSKNVLHTPRYHLGSFGALFHSVTI